MSNCVRSRPHNKLTLRTDHYLGVDVGTGSARVCIVDSAGDIKALATENIGIWQPETGYYVSILPGRILKIRNYRLR
jgi:hypothetical protein